ncbi:MAG: hypothetical protein KAS12_01490 [Candidatus Aenigmarchaeota archaeon]|nr:hypothetical protein [Candidatus Aenigmarchaeota archaeon]
MDDYPIVFALVIITFILIYIVVDSMGIEEITNKDKDASMSAAVNSREHALKIIDNTYVGEYIGLTTSGQYVSKKGVNLRKNILAGQKAIFFVPNDIKNPINGKFATIIKISFENSTTFLELSNTLPSAHNVSMFVY